MNHVSHPLAAALALVTLLSTSCVQREACVQLSDAELAKLASSAPSVASAPAAPPSGSAVLYDLPKSGDFAPPPAPEGASPSADVQPLTPMLAVEVSAAGAITCNGRPLTLEALTALARRTAEAEPQVRAVIRADGAATHRTVMAVLDHLKQGGISRVAFAVVAAPAP